MDAPWNRPVPPARTPGRTPAGLRQKLQKLGAEKFSAWLLKQKPLLLTDTTMRDAHQSLLATRMRTHDMLRIAPFLAHRAPGLFSLEMWGGATFDSAMRFLKEDPFERLDTLRTAVPNILFQMLLRSGNAVGYTNYPDDIVKRFVKGAAEHGIDVFRVFDCLNWLPNLRPAMDAVLEAGAICEPAICYTGDLLDPARQVHASTYYVKLAKQLEKAGAHILAIKDMAGLCKPYAAYKLVKTLREEIGLPIHFHTHDTAGIQAASILKAAEAGATIADVAAGSMSGLTSQVNMNSIVEALRNTPRATGLDMDALNAYSAYWEAVRKHYYPFESGMMASTAEVYHHEMPGGQVTNLQEQAKSMGLGPRWPEVARAYAQVKPAVRRHREGDPDQQGGGRHGAVYGGQQPARCRPARRPAATSPSPPRWWSCSRASSDNRWAAGRKNCSHRAARQAGLDQAPGRTAAGNGLRGHPEGARGQTARGTERDRPAVLPDVPQGLSGPGRAPETIRRHRHAAHRGVLPRHEAGP
jgi:pyruvate carboxylase